MDGGDPALRGRGDELHVLEDAIAAAVAGAGRIVVIEGEAGIGKTRLIHEASGQAADLGCTVLIGAAEELEQGRPFGAFVAALDLTRDDGARDDVAGEPGGSLPAAVRAGSASPDARFLAQEAILEHLERLAEQGPVLLALDDLHWSDRATLATAWSLARRLERLPVALVLASRRSPRTADLERVLVDCERQGAATVSLGPLDSAAVRALAADVTGTEPDPQLLDQLEGTAGNPFFVLELARASSEPGAAMSTGPEALRLAVLRRVGALGGGVDDLLSAAAVLGDSFTLDDVAVLLDRSVASLVHDASTALDAGLLDGDGPRLTFRHDIIREALYERQAPGVRVALHREAARRLGARLDPAVRARHLILGVAPGDGDAVAELRAAASDLAPHDPDAASAVFARAVELTRDPLTEAELRCDQAVVLLASGRAREAEETADTALRISPLPPELRAELHLSLGEACSHQGSLGQSIAHFGAALDLDVLEPARRAYALGRKAENRVWTFDLGAAWREADEARATGEQVGAPAVITEAYASQTAVCSFGARFDDAIELGEAAVAAAGDDPDALRRTPHAYLGFALMGADRQDDARRVTQEGRKRSAELGQVLVLPNYHQLLVRLGWFSGEWDDALAEAEAAASLEADFGLGWGIPGNDAIRGLVAFHRGDLETARARYARSTRARTPGGDEAGSELGVLLGAQLLEVDGELRAASDLLHGMFSLMRGAGMHATRLWVGPDTVRLLLATGQTAVAVDEADDVVQVAATSGTHTAQGAAAAVQGLVADDPTAHDAAATHYHEGGRPLDELRAREWAGDALVRAARPEEAAVRYRDALDIAQRLDAEHDARRLLAALRELGVRVGTRSAQQRATTGWDALTGAERAVAVLIDEGLRNGEIAERLFVSRRTVETHVGRLYRKLGAENRVALANAIREQMVA
jgi:DNA-binding CsgD family transcriptional regulator